MDETLGLFQKQINEINNILKHVHEPFRPQAKSELCYLCRMTRSIVEQEAGALITRLENEIERLEKENEDGQENNEETNN